MWQAREVIKELEGRLQSTQIEAGMTVKASAMSQFKQILVRLILGRARRLVYVWVSNVKVRKKASVMDWAMSRRQKAPAHA